MTREKKYWLFKREQLLSIHNTKTEALHAKRELLKGNMFNCPDYIIVGTINSDALLAEYRKGKEHLYEVELTLGGTAKMSSFLFETTGYVLAHSYEFARELALDFFPKDFSRELRNFCEVNVCRVY